MDALPNEPDWSTLDALIFENGKLEVLQALRERHGFTLEQAITALSERYRVLRLAQPQRFTCSEAEYWAGFYS